MIFIKSVFGSNHFLPACLVFLFTTPLIAQTYDNHMIPYRGQLQRDGVAQDGDFDLFFHLYDAQSEGTEVWSEEHLAQPVYSGEFSAVLGSQSALSDEIWQTEELFLSVEVRESGNSNEPDYIPLGGRQQILYVPYAAQAGSATNMVITGTLELQSDLTLSGNIEIGGDQSSLTITDDDGEPILRVTENGSRGLVELLDDDEATDLVVSGSVEIQSDLTLGGNIKIGDDQSSLAITDDDGEMILRITENDTRGLVELLDDDEATDLVVSGSVSVTESVSVTGSVITEQIKITSNQGSIDITDDDGETIVRVTENSSNGQVELLDGASLYVEGTVSWQCPSNMTRLGTWCIDNSTRSGTWPSATNYCHEQYKTLCPIEVLMMCDEIEPSTSDCDDETDSSGLIWSWGTTYSDFGDSVFSEIATFNGGDNLVDRASSSNTHNYFCCMPGYFKPAE